MGKEKLVWLSKDDKAKAEHEPLLINAGISTVWLRGMGRSSKRGISTKKNQIRMKDVLFMLVNKIEQLQEEIGSSGGSKHFILYVNDSTRKASQKKYSTLREVRDALAGESPGRRRRDRKIRN